MNGLSVTSMTKHTASWCCSPAATAQGACPKRHATLQLLKFRMQTRDPRSTRASSLPRSDQSELDELMVSEPFEWACAELG
jgi:hypothetical protein